MTDNTTPPPVTSTPAQPLSASDEKLWATLIHVGGIIIGFISPLVGYLVLKDRSSFVEAHSKTALNFQITISGIQIVNFILGLILSIVTIGIWGLTVQPLIFVAALVVNIIFSIIAALKANRGELYSYPLAIKFIK